MLSPGSSLSHLPLPILWIFTYCYNSRVTSIHVRFSTQHLWLQQCQLTYYQPRWNNSLLQPCLTGLKQPMTTKPLATQPDMSFGGFFSPLLVEVVFFHQTLRRFFAVHLWMYQSEICSSQVMVSMSNIFMSHLHVFLKHGCGHPIFLLPFAKFP